MRCCLFIPPLSKPLLPKASKHFLWQPKSRTSLPLSARAGRNAPGPARYPPFGVERANTVWAAERKIFLHVNFTLLRAACKTAARRPLRMASLTVEKPSNANPILAHPGRKSAHPEPR